VAPSGLLGPDVYVKEHLAPANLVINGPTPVRNKVGRTNDFIELLAPDPYAALAPKTAIVSAIVSPPLRHKYFGEVCAPAPYLPFQLGLKRVPLAKNEAIDRLPGDLRARGPTEQVVDLAWGEPF
jgi:hypothetical protein